MKRLSVGCAVFRTSGASTALCAVTLLLGAAGQAGAQKPAAPSGLEREFEQVKEQHEREITQAIGPINKRYEASLDLLLKRASPSAQAELIMRIRREKQALAEMNAPQPPSTQPGGPQPAAGQEFAFRAAGRDYKLLKKKVTFDEAVAYCKAQGGTLVCFSSDKEAQAIRKEMGRFFPGETPTYWVGLTRETGAEDFRWLDGARFEGKVYGKERGSCFVHVDINGAFNTYDRNNKDHVLCELPK